MGPAAELRPCDLCGAPPARQSRTWPGTEPGSASHGYMTCGDCGLVQANPLPADDMAAFHADQYAADGAREETVPDRLHKLDPSHSRDRLYSEAYQRWARGLLDRLRGCLGGAAGPAPRFLEVGCAAGGVLKAARELGMEAVGTEVSREAAEFGVRELGLDIRIGLLEDLTLDEASFDIVLLHDVIEHVPSPAQLLRECARVMRPGGVICLHTVNVDSLTVSVAKGGFFLADTSGGHCTLFSPATLRRYCEGAGLDVLTVETRGFRIVQRERDRRSMGWKRAWIRLAENIGHEFVKLNDRGHFIMVTARKR